MNGNIAIQNLSGSLAAPACYSDLVALNSYSFVSYLSCVSNAHHHHHHHSN